MTLSTHHYYKLTLTIEERSALIRLLELIENSKTQQVQPDDTEFFTDLLETLRSDR